jgi:hypothetical protein
VPARQASHWAHRLQRHRFGTSSRNGVGRAARALAKARKSRRQAWTWRVTRMRVVLPLRGRRLGRCEKSAPRAPGSAGEHGIGVRRVVGATDEQVHVAARGGIHPARRGGVRGDVGVMIACQRRCPSPNLRRSFACPSKRRACPSFFSEIGSLRVGGCEGRFAAKTASMECRAARSARCWWGFVWAMRYEIIDGKTSACRHNLVQFAIWWSARDGSSRNYGCVMVVGGTVGVLGARSGRQPVVRGGGAGASWGIRSAAFAEVGTRFWVAAVKQGGFPPSPWAGPRDRLRTSDPVPPEAG